MLATAGLVAPPAAGAGGADALVPPVRLTAGASDQLLGDLSPDGRSLWFVSDRDAITQIYVQDVRRGGPRLAFEADADVTGPRVSPDGRRVLYVSDEADATGDVCILEIESGERFCVTGPETSESQAFWYPDGRSVGAVSRAGMHADLQLRRFPAKAGQDRGEVVVARNLASPALSPDGRVVAYVPVVRAADAVGPRFAMRAGGALELRDAGGRGEAVPVAVDLPGVSGFPAFSADGRWLYFAQYLNDTTLDGRIDGDDHSVLFRLALDGGRPAAGARPEQLTSARWSCGYPAPARDRVVVTCEDGGSLDVFSLPPEGSVPGSWTVERVEAELEVSRDPWERLLLLGRKLALDPDPGPTLTVLRRMVRLHLELGEYESAEFYVRRLRGLGGGDAGASTWARAVLELVRHRRAERRLNRGELSPSFLAEQEAALRRLEEVEAQAPAQGAAAAIARLVSAEILGVIGLEGAARDRIEALDVASISDPFALHLAGEGPVALWLLLGERGKALELLGALAGHEALEVPARLAFAEAFVRTLLRGRPYAERPGLVAAELAAAEPGSELALLLEVETWLQRLGKAPSEEVRKGIFEIYRVNRDVARRRAVTFAAVRRAADTDDELVLYEMANSWASWLARAHPERKYAEVLYREVVLERAYVELAEGNVADARGHFFGVTRQTDALEAHAGFVEARLAEGHDDVLQTYERIYRKEPNHPVMRYVRAWLLARSLPPRDDREAHAAAVAAARAHAGAAAEAMPLQAEAHVLLAYLDHRDWLRDRRGDAALAAYDGYLLALELGRGRPRLEASVHLAAGLLQAGVGNHRLALQHLDARLRLPWASPAGELAAVLTRARSLFHLGRVAQAAEATVRALALVEESPAELARFRPLVLDRAGLYRYAAGDPAGAAEAWAAPAEGDGHNALKRALMLGAATLDAGDAQAALPHLDEAARRLAALSLPEEHRYHDGRRDYALAIAGLRARALRAMGRPLDADAALATRQRLQEARVQDRDVDGDLLDLARTRARRADIAREQGRNEEALRHLEAALRLADTWRERTGTPVAPIGPSLLQAYVGLHLDAKVPLDRYALDVRERLNATYAELCRLRNPERAAERFALAAVLTLLDL